MSIITPSELRGSILAIGKKFDQKYSGMTSCIVYNIPRWRKIRAVFHCDYLPSGMPVLYIEASHKLEVSYFEYFGQILVVGG